MGRPALPDGLVAIVKRDCETCRMVVPVLRQLASERSLTVYTQDDPEFPGDPAATFDDELAISWHHEIETVPTLIRVVDGVEVGRTVGWLRPDWERLTGVATLGEGLPEFRPGCGSKSVDPDLVDELRVRHGGSVLRSRRIEIAELEDEFEMMFSRGVDRWAPGRAAHRGARAGDARRHVPGRPTRSSPPSRPTWSTSPSRRSRSPP